MNVRIRENTNEERREVGDFFLCARVHAVPTKYIYLLLSRGGERNALRLFDFGTNYQFVRDNCNRGFFGAYRENVGKRARRQKNELLKFSVRVRSHGTPWFRFENMLQCRRKFEIPSSGPCFRNSKFC